MVYWNGSGNIFGNIPTPVFLGNIPVTRAIMDIIPERIENGMPGKKILGIPIQVFRRISNSSTRN